MIPEIFFDGVSEIGFGGGVVRIEFATIEPGKKGADGKPAKTPRQRVIMTPQGVLETYAAMQGIVNKLVELGVLEKRAAEAPAGKGGSSSPNFS